MGRSVTCCASFGRFAPLGSEHGYNPDPGLSPGQQVSGSKDWWDGLIGLRGRYDTEPCSYLTGTALIGAGGSDFTADLFAGFGYEVSDVTSLVGGYRYLTTDREDNGYIYDIEQQGLLFGATFATP